MKAASGKFAPVSQWLYFDAEEIIPANGVSLLPVDDTAPRGTRFDAHRTLPEPGVLWRQMCPPLQVR